MFLQVAKDGNTTRPDDAKLCAHCCISDAGGRRSDPGKDAISRRQSRDIPKSISWNVLDPLTRIPVDDTEYGLSGGVSRSHIEPVVTAVIPNLITSADLGDDVDEPPINCIQDVGGAATNRNHL